MDILEQIGVQRWHLKPGYNANAADAEAGSELLEQNIKAVLPGEGVVPQLDSYSQEQAGPISADESTEPLLESSNSLDLDVNVGVISDAAIQDTVIENTGAQETISDVSSSFSNSPPQQSQARSQSQPQATAEIIGVESQVMPDGAVNMHALEQNEVQSEPRDSWQALAELLEHNNQCDSCKPINAVLGDGDIHADWVFVIDAPSTQDIQAQQLLSGRVGQLFDAILRAIDLSREQIYLTSIFKCPPSQDLTLMAECGALVHRQIGLIRPKVIVCLGEFSAQSLVRSNASLNELRDSELIYNNGSLTNKCSVISTYDLPKVLDNPMLKADVWKDLKKYLGTL